MKKNLVTTTIILYFRDLKNLITSYLVVVIGRRRIVEISKLRFSLNNHRSFHKKYANGCIIILSFLIFCISFMLKYVKLSS